MDIQFTGEHLLPGKLGQFFIVLSFGTSILSLLSYYFATTTKDKLDLSWQKLGRLAYGLNLVAIIGVGACLFYIIYNHLFEYHYAWAHSSKILPVYYTLSDSYNIFVQNLNIEEPNTAHTPLPLASIFVFCACKCSERYI